MTPSQIGVLLRDSNGIPQISTVTGSKVLRILKASGLAPEIPEDLYHLIKKAVSMRKHLERNRKDKDGKFRLILVESRIHRLARYYKVRACAGLSVFLHRHLLHSWRAVQVYASACAKHRASSCE